MFWVQRGRPFPWASTTWTLMMSLSGGYAQMLEDEHESPILALLDDDLLSQIAAVMDVACQMRFGRACRRLHRAVVREAFPWTSMELEQWVCIPNPQKSMTEIFRSALEQVQDSALAFDRRLQIAKLYGDAGLYSRGTELLNGALLQVGDDEVLMSDVLLGLSKVSWRAQQAREGGGLGFVKEIVDCASRSCELRRDVAKRSVLHTRRLAEGLEVLGENAASYGSAIIANDDTDEEDLSGRMFQLADDSIDECIRLWTELGDSRKLADAVAASAAIDFYSGREYEGAMTKLERAMALASKDGGRNATTALCLFNMAYITQNVRGDTIAALELYQKCLDIRTEVLGNGHPFTRATTDEILVSSVRLMQERMGTEDPSGDADGLRDYIQNLLMESDAAADHQLNEG